MHINTGRWTEDELDKIIREAAEKVSPGERISLISGHLLGTPYKSGTLIGSSETEEELVIDLSGMDCFTFIDYVEAMRSSGSFSEFRSAVKEVRYRSGIVSFSSRNHFFTDWAEYRTGSVRDVTDRLGLSVKTEKMLNQKKDGSLYLGGLKPYPRTVSYLPPEAVSPASLDTGDYAGIYSNAEGLDVSHVGIIIRKGGLLLFRHASSDKNAMKVVDQDLREYISSKPGLVVLRPLND